MNNSKNALNETFVKIRDEVKVQGGIVAGGDGLGQSIGNSLSRLGAIFAGSIDLGDLTEAGVGVGAVVSQGGIFSFRNIQTDQTFVGKRLDISSTVNAISSVAGSIVTQGGIAVAKDVYANGKITGNTVLGRSSLDMVYDGKIKVLRSDNLQEFTTPGTSTLIEAGYGGASIDQDVVKFYTPGAGSDKSKMTMYANGQIEIGNKDVAAKLVTTLNRDSKIGIGNDNPQQKLHVTNSRIRIETIDTPDNATPGDPVLELHNNTPGGNKFGYIYETADGQLTIRNSGGVTKLDECSEVGLYPTSTLKTTAPQVQFGTSTGMSKVAINKGTIDSAFALECVGNVKIDGNFTVTGTSSNLTPTSSFRVTDVSESTSPTSGSLGTDGGLGVSKNITCGGKIAAASTQLSSGPNASAKIYTDGDMYVAGNATIGGTLSIPTLSVPSIAFTSPGSKITWTPGNMNLGHVPLADYIVDQPDGKSFSINELVNRRIFRTSSNTGVTDTFPAFDNDFSAAFGSSNAQYEFEWVYININDSAFITLSGPVFIDYAAGDRPFGGEERTSFSLPPKKHVIIRGQCRKVGTVYRTNFYLQNVVDNEFYYNLNGRDASGTNTTTSLSGSFQHFGGASVLKNLRVGNSLTNTGQLLVDNATQSSSSSTGCSVLAGGLGVAKNLNVGGSITNTGPLIVNNTTESTSFSTGSAIFKGGVGITKNLFLDGKIDSTNLSESSNLSTGAVVLSGGMAVNKSFNVGGNVNIEGITVLNNSLFCKGRNNVFGESFPCFVGSGGRYVTFPTPYVGEQGSFNIRADKLLAGIVLIRSGFNCIMTLPNANDIQAALNAPNNVEIMRTCHVFISKATARDFFIQIPNDATVISKNGLNDTSTFDFAGQSGEALIYILFSRSNTGENFVVYAISYVV